MASKKHPQKFVQQSTGVNSAAYLNDRNKLNKLKESQSKREEYIQELIEKIANSIPHQRPSKDNSLTEKKFKEDYKKAKEKYEQTEFLLETNYATSDRNSCLIDINSRAFNFLRKITLKDMMVNKMHYGHALECKTIADPFYVSGMNLLIQDSNGDIENLIVYNYETKSIDIDPKFLIPIGTRLLIKEPHLQHFGLEDDNFGIRVDSPTDIVIQSYPDVDSNKSVEELIEEGNKAFGKSYLYPAIRFYSQAIEKSNKTSSRAYLNRSQAYLRLEKNYSAFQDSQQAAKLDKNNDKAYFRIGKSAYLLRKFEIALESYETCFKLNPKNTEVEIEIKKTKERINESKTGNYNFQALYEQFFKRENLYMDIADYMSNKIMITDVKNKSKGVVATEFIKKGTLLMASKAAVAVFHNKVDYRKKSQNTVFCCEGQFNSKNETENISSLVYKMQDDPELAGEIYSLYAGPNFGRNKLSHPIIDIKRIEAIFSFNSFQIKNSYEALDVIEMEKEAMVMEGYDAEEFSDLDFPSINFKSDIYNNLTKMQIKYNNLNKQCGIWYLSAFFNHSCISNCIKKTIGDMMTFYALRDIEKGEEITIRYFPPEWSYSRKETWSTQIYGFKCDCKMCQLDEQDQMVPIREKLSEQIEFKNSNLEMNLSEALTDVTKMRYTYLKRKEYPLQLINPLQVLAATYRIDFCHQMSAKVFEEIFELIKEFNEFGAITILKETLSDYKKCGDKEKCEACKKKAFEYFASLTMHKIYSEKIWHKMLQQSEIL